MEMPQLAKETSALAKHKEFLWLKQGNNKVCVEGDGGKGGVGRNMLYL